MDGLPVFRSSEALRVPPEQRPIAMVFQSYALWPHMDVFQNIAFPLQRGLRRIDSAQVKPRVEHAAELLNLTPYLTRSVAQLSGGQQQRVALARAIALQPRVLLMDEPLSNLDARLRAHLRVELRALTRSIGMTTVYVTHDQAEAMVMGDRVAVMEAGCMLQEGSPVDLYQRPREMFVAKFLGDMNFLRARVESGAGAHFMLRTQDRALRALAHARTPTRGAEVAVGFRPEDVVLYASDPGHNGVPATVAARHYVGDAQLYQLDVSGESLQVRAPKHQLFEPGSPVFACVDPDACLIFDIPASETQA